MGFTIPGVGSVYFLGYIYLKKIKKHLTLFDYHHETTIRGSSRGDKDQLPEAQYNEALFSVLLHYIVVYSEFLLEGGEDLPTKAQLILENVVKVPGLIEMTCGRFDGFEDWFSNSCQIKQSTRKAQFSDNTSSKLLNPAFVSLVDIQSLIASDEFDQVNSSLPRMDPVNLPKRKLNQSLQFSSILDSRDCAVDLVQFGQCLANQSGSRERILLTQSLIEKVKTRLFKSLARGNLHVKLQQLMNSLNSKSSCNWSVGIMLLKPRSFAKSRIGEVVDLIGQSFEFVEHYILFNKHGGVFSVCRRQKVSLFSNNKPWVMLGLKHIFEERVY